MSVTIDMKTIFFLRRTHSNVLELFEYSLNTTLQQNHFQLIFQNSKVVPGKLFSDSFVFCFRILSSLASHRLGV